MKGMILILFVVDFPLQVGADVMNNWLEIAVRKDHQGSPCKPFSACYGSADNNPLASHCCLETAKN